MTQDERRAQISPAASDKETKWVIIGIAIDIAICFALPFALWNAYHCPGMSC